MDTVKQAFAGIVGSMVLGGCLTSPNVVYVPETDVEETQDTNDETGDVLDDGGAAAGPLFSPFTTDGIAPVPPGRHAPQPEALV